MSPRGSAEGSQLPEIRRHYFLPQYVVIAPNRLRRPHYALQTGRDVTSPKECHFCPGNEEPAEISRLEEDGKWQLRVIPNKFPAFAPDHPKAFGYQEIVVETPNHAEEMGSFDLTHLKAVIDAYAERTSWLEAKPGVRFVLVFKNEGEASGASMSHAHSQIYAIPFVPPDLQEEARALKARRQGGVGCLYCEILAKERQGPRLIWENEHMTAFTPYAAQAPYEVWVLPRIHRRGLGELSGAERMSLAWIMKLTLARLEEEGISYNYYIHNSLPEDDHHMHLKIIPRLTTWGGFELGSGVVINPVAPEESPRFYRENAA